MQNFRLFFYARSAFKSNARETWCVILHQKLTAKISISLQQISYPCVRILFRQLSLCFIFFSFSILFHNYVLDNEHLFTKVFLFYHKNGNPARRIPMIPMLCSLCSLCSLQFTHHMHSDIVHPCIKKSCRKWESSRLR